MDKDFIIKTLKELNHSNPHLFAGIDQQESRMIQGEWISRLSKYSEDELKDAIECYPFPKKTRYNSRVLDGIIEVIEDERHRPEALERYRKSVERLNGLCIAKRNMRW